ncbi:adenine-specific DNA methyltransferase [Helicobacter mustelae]|uniref:HsdM family class I SAM-dependent methyltransferase n=1 Tax=Helicobacter mustelae TaxID=217 RepID=UPI000DFBE49B|nr:N-6 DNA methylase [Helicobacter mustelae]STP12410.1 adenine-specific DNA methyltransferase [Helicobacter mustelae]
MARDEVKTDSWVRGLLEVANIPFTEQGGGIKELDEAFKTASKSLSGNAGYPDFCAVVKDFVFVFEDKADVSKHCKLDPEGCIDLENADSVKNYAANGAIHYGKHLAKHTNYKKIIAIAVSGNEKRHKITPYFIDEKGFVTKDLEDLEDFIVFNEENIEEYYTKEILKEQTSQEKTTEQLLKDASDLHEDLRNYGNLRDTEKPIVVSGILLALEEIRFKNFDLERLNADGQKSDGAKIYGAIVDNLKRANVGPDVKKDKLLSQFSIIKDAPKINEVNSTLGKTPLKHYAEFLYKRIYQNIKYTQTSEDILGRFYGEFMSYSGGDGQTLGIVLTPKHICELFCDLAKLKPDDRVFDPCCGTAGFLIAAMHNMLLQVTNDTQKQEIKENQLFGIEERADMFSIATTNMILRGDGKSNLDNKDFLKQNPPDLQKDKAATVGMMNPPYSQGSKANPALYEIAFSEHLCDSILKGGRVIVIVPQSAMTGKSKEEKAIKANILKKHTLEGVITLNKNTFYGIGTNPCIAIFKAGIPHQKDKICKFINFENDGFVVQKHKGLVETIHAKDKKAHLLKVWRDEMEAESKFCVKTTIEAEDEWLHSFYYFNDEIPQYEDFDKTMADYLTFEFNMITHGRGYLFGLEEEKADEAHKGLENE